MKATRLIYLFLIFGSFLYCTCSDDNGGVGEPDNGDDPGNGGNTAFTLSEFNKNYVFLESNSKVKDLNFYWTTLVENTTEISSAIENDEDLSAYLETAKQRLNNIANQDNVTATQFANALKFSDNERVFISTSIKKVVEDNASTFISFSNAHIGPSGAFNKFGEVMNVDRFHQLIVEEMLLGINQIIDTYVEGVDPLYPIIDSVSYDVNSAQYKLLLKNLVADLNTNVNDQRLFYEPFLKFALGVLQLNDRDEAGRYFPIQNGENSAAYQYLQSLNWADFDYSVIVVLGDSPNSSGDLPNISIGGMERADHGVTLYNQGKAPLIAFCGGHLMPVHTIYSEAIEMKKYVMETYNIPENRILVDPHSRHTTTNLRNIGRQFFRYGIPTDKKAIVSSSSSHSGYVASSGFLTRCQNEMGHIPLTLYERLSDFDLEFTPLIEVLHLDSSDPLDP
jgi:hypothetical protein